jgi:hypothetical protein
VLIQDPHDDTLDFVKQYIDGEELTVTSNVHDYTLKKRRALSLLKATRRSAKRAEAQGGRSSNRYENEQAAFVELASAAAYLGYSIRRPEDLEALHDGPHKMELDTMAEASAYHDMSSAACIDTVRKAVARFTRNVTKQLHDKLSARFVFGLSRQQLTEYMRCTLQVREKRKQLLAKLRSVEEGIEKIRIHLDHKPRVH